MGTLTGEVAIITGAQQGIGRAIALALARAGADVVINYLDDADSADAIAEAARAEGVKAIGVPADISKPDAVEVLMRAASAIASAESASSR